MALPPEPPDDQPGPPPAPDAEGGECPRCGTPYEPLQEYCLECGLRLPVQRGVIPVLATAWRRRFRRYPGDWIWPVLGLLIVAALAAAVGILATQGNDSPTKTRAETQASVPLSTGTAPTTSTPTDTSTLPTVPTTTAPEQPPPPPPSNTLIQWPAGQNGWTIVLSSIPQSGGPRGRRQRRAKGPERRAHGRRNPRLVPVLEPAHGLLRGLHRGLRQRERSPSRTRHGAGQLSRSRTSAK